MTAQAHPTVLTKMADQRRADLYAWADGYRLARLAAQRTERQAWTDLATVIAVVVVLALLLAATSSMADVAEASLHPTSPSLWHGEARAVTQVADEHLLDPGAAQTVSAARL